MSALKVNVAALVADALRKMRPDLEVLAEVVEERGRQDEQWGEQNHPDGTGPDVVWTYTGPASFVRDSAKATTDGLAALGTVTWRDIAVEELAEALAEDDEEQLRAEVIQLAAVCVQWAQAIDRRLAARAEADQ